MLVFDKTCDTADYNVHDTNNCTLIPLLADKIHIEAHIVTWWTSYGLCDVSCIMYPKQPPSFLRQT